MAATRLMALHINKGKTLAQCLQERTDYASNPEKTEKGEWVTAYECDPMTVDEEFLLSKRRSEMQEYQKVLKNVEMFLQEQGVESVQREEAAKKDEQRRMAEGKEKRHEDR